MYSRDAVVDCAAASFPMVPMPGNSRNTIAYLSCSSVHPASHRCSSRRPVSVRPEPTQAGRVLEDGRPAGGGPVRGRSLVCFRSTDRRWRASPRPPSPPPRWRSRGSRRQRTDRSRRRGCARAYACRGVLRTRCPGHNRADVRYWGLSSPPHHGRAGLPMRGARLLRQVASGLAGIAEELLEVVVVDRLARSCAGPHRAALTAALWPRAASPTRDLDFRDRRRVRLSRGK